MPFDVEGAKKAGYSDTEIADFLSQDNSFDSAGARKAGYSDTEIISHLQPPKAPERQIPMSEQIFGTKEGWTNPENWKRVFGSTGRIVTDAAASIPLAAADAGIAARNLLTGENYGSATDQYKQAAESIGLPNPQTPVEKGVNFLGQAIVGSKIPAPTSGTQAPKAFDPKSIRQLALDKAREAGYVLPPSTTNPSVLNRILESIGGKDATAIDASVRNQATTDALVKKSLGLSKTADVAEGTLSTLRQEAAQKGYAPLRDFGQVRLDTSYQKALDEIASPYLKAESAFPGLAKNDIATTVETLKKGSVDSSTAMDTISILRDKADVAFRAGDNSVGKAFKAMASQLENAIERSLGRRGEDASDLLKNFREARTQIAKTYTAEKALNAELGTFDARKLAQELSKGKPLTGDMKKVAQASQAFKNATKLVTDSGSVRNTDVMFGGATAAASGQPWMLLYPFGRMAVRDALLSNKGQGLLTSPSGNYGASPELLMGASTSLLGP
jgi:hypothetical protein